MFDSADRPAPTRRLPRLGSERPHLHHLPDYRPGPDQPGWRTTWFRRHRPAEHSLPSTAD